MIVKLIVSSLFVFSTSSARTLVEPKIEILRGEANLVLGADVTKALKLYDAGFSLLRNNQFRAPVVSLFNDKAQEVPMALVDDFNADNVKDIVLLGTTEKDGKPKVKAILFVSHKDHYKPFLVEWWASDRYLNWVETRSGAKEIRDWHMYFKILHESEKRILKSGGLLKIPKATKGFKVMNHYGSGHPYYFKKGKVFTFSKTPPKGGL